MAKPKKPSPQQKSAPPRSGAPNVRTEASASRSDAGKEKRAKAAADSTSNRKLDALQRDRENADEQFLTTNQGLRMEDDHNTLRAGARGPSLLEDFHFREKVTHFDHERIPERIVHARGSAAHGFFQAYDDSLSTFTKARFLTDPSRRTPVFVRFSTVAGSRGSTDLARDASGAGTALLAAAGITGAKPHPEAGPDADPRAGVVTGGRNLTAEFIAAIAQHRHWNRGLKPPLPVPAAD